MTRERQLWTDYVRRIGERKEDKRGRRRRAKKKSEVPQAELEAALDDLTKDPPSERGCSTQPDRAASPGAELKPPID